MNGFPRFAIVVPVFNADKYIAECLNSLLAQKYKYWTAYCVDDGSTDMSAAILDRYSKKDSRIVVFHKKNGGVASARNYALDRLGDEEWISFVDADDYISSDMYNSIVSALNRNSEMSIDYIRVFPQKTRKRYSGNNALNTTDIVNNVERVVSPYDYFQNEKVGGFVASLLVRSILVKNNRIRFVETMRVLEDQVFSIECALKANSIMVYNNVHYFYYNNPNSATRKTIDISNDIIQCINYVERAIRESDLSGISDYFKEQFMPEKMSVLLNERMRHFIYKNEYGLFDSFDIKDYKLPYIEKFKYSFLNFLKRI